MHKIVPKPSADDETWFFLEFVSDDEEEEELSHCVFALPRNFQKCFFIIYPAYPY